MRPPQTKQECSSFLYFFIVLKGNIFFLAQKIAVVAEDLLFAHQLFWIPWSIPSTQKVVGADTNGQPFPT
jgi:hypothetical protein